MNKPLSRSRFGRKFDENFDRIFSKAKKEPPREVACKRCGVKYVAEQWEKIDKCDKCARKEGIQSEQ